VVAVAEKGDEATRESRRIDRASLAMIHCNHEPL
jgi:hypothetical protein